MKISNTRLNSLQAYRGIAAVMVVLFHMTVFAHEHFNVDLLGKSFSFGYVGVDFFFVLSGFIIYFVNRKVMGVSQAVQPYLLKRFLRVYPIYWLITTAKIVVLFTLPSFAKPYETNVGQILRSYVLFPQPTDLPIIGAAWTLSYEVMFYLIFGLAIVLGLWWFRRIFAIWGISILAFQIIRLVAGTGFQSNYLLDFILNERNFEFMLGCLSAYLILNHQIPYRAWILAMGVIVFTLSAVYVDNNGVVPSYTLFFGIASFLIVTASAGIESQRPFKLPRSLIFLGDASYSVYLTHALFINIFALILTRLDLVTRFGPTLPLILMAVFAIIGGCLVYGLVEKPLLSIMNKWVKTRKVVVEQVASA
ncbi:MAG: acyltransferase [Anaerolineae bacterium]|nr:acyltransferase [Anaerolineae bacterium]